MDASKTPDKTAAVTSDIQLNHLTDKELFELSLALAAENRRRLFDSRISIDVLQDRNDNLASAYRDLHVSWYSIPAFIRRIFEVKEDA